MGDAGFVRLDGRTLTPAALSRIGAGADAVIDENALLRMESSARWYATAGDPHVVRGKWPFLMQGERSDEAVVRAFVLGHCAGVGEPLPEDLTRAVMAARANVLATGTSGARKEIAQVYVHMLREGIIPVVPSKGSVGAAGDLAPLAHISRVACGFGGKVWKHGKPVPASSVPRSFEPVSPTEKEALSMINGATMTAAIAAIACHRARRLLQTAEAAAALSFDVVRADLHCLSVEALGARRHPGAVDTARRLQRQLLGSGLCGEGRKPDPFSIRCLPAVLGSAWDTLDHVETIVTRELNGACDNPLVLQGGDIVEAGNFHGAPVASAMDQLKIALTQVAGIAERRVFRMTYGQLSGLPSFLVPGTGLNSGLMIAQYTAASLVSECKGWSHPASVDTIPTVQHHEDHVSMGPIAARGALLVIEALADVLAIELMCGAQGLDLQLERGEGPAGQGTATTRDRVRERVERWHDDQVLYPDLHALGVAVRGGEFTAVSGAW